MLGSGEEERRIIRPEFDRSTLIDFQAAKITSDTGFLLLRETDDRLGSERKSRSVLEGGMFMWRRRSPWLDGYLAVFG